MERKRLDLLLLERQLASTRTKAQSLIAEGKVEVNGAIVRRAGEKFPNDCHLRLLEQEHPYVSRGGLKLAAALAHFSLSVEDLRVLDVGQSTGGFTHCLLLHGAARVVGVEVGIGQLDPSLRSNPRVECFEKQDIRTIAADRLAPAFPRFVVDLSFISLALVLPHLRRLLAPRAEGVLLVKPQFEVGPENVGSGGIVRDAAMREAALEEVKQISRANGFTVAGEILSPIAGGDGNVEYLLHLREHS